MMRNTIKTCLPAILIGLLLFLSGCYTDDPNDWLRIDIGVELSETQARDIIEDALDYQTVGLPFEVSKVAEMAAPILQNTEPYNVCGTVQSIPLDYVLLGEEPLLTYSGTFSATLQCNEENLPLLLEVNTRILPSYTIDVNNPTVIYANESRGQWQVMPDSLHSDFSKIDGEQFYRRGQYFYERAEGIHSPKHYIYKITFDLLEFTYNAMEKKIEAGSAHFLLEVTRSSTSDPLTSYSEEGAVVFDSDGKKEVELAGKSFVIGN